MNRLFISSINVIKTNRDFMDNKIKFIKTKAKKISPKNVDNILKIRIRRIRANYILI
jgi:hypothetical protein